MKKYIILAGLLSVGLNISAQTPEFYLRFDLFSGNTSRRFAILGFDPNAYDTIEDTATNETKWFLNEYGETEQRMPPFVFPGEPDMRMKGDLINRVNDLTTDGSKVDVRHKPQQDSFILEYELDVQPGEGSNYVVRWDIASIPSIIKHITVESGQVPGKVLFDMKTQSSLSLANKDTAQKYQKMILKLYYNRGLLGVNEDGILDGSISLSSNPISEQSSTLSIFNDRPSQANVTIFDMTGRQIQSIDQELHVGLNRIPLSKSLFPASGAYIVRIRTSDSHGVANTSRIVHVVK